MTGPNDPTRPLRQWPVLVMIASLAGPFAGTTWAQQPSGAAPDATADNAAASQPAQPSSGSGFVDFFKKTEVSAFVDVYFTYNFNKPAGGTVTPLRNFDTEHKQLNFALTELALTKAATADSRLGFRFDADYGDVADMVNAFEPADADVLENIQQAYGSYLVPIGSGLTVDAGKFVTALGSEVIESKDNWNYSRSFLFALAIPYYHVGARLGYALSDRISLGGTVTNGWNNASDNNSRKTVGLSATVKPASRLAIVQNYLAGPEQVDDSDDWRHVWDTTVTLTLNDRISLMGNYDHGRDRALGQTVTWQGVALYARAQATDLFAITPRIEYYDDLDGFTTGASQILKEFTLTGEIKHPHGFIIRAEYRRDWSSIDFFEHDGRTTDNQDTFTIGVVYAFSRKAP